MQNQGKSDQVERNQAALVKLLEAAELTRSEIRLVVLIAELGEPVTIGAERCTALTRGRRRLADLLNCSPTTITAAAGRLAARGVLEVVHVARARTYVVAWSRVARLEPPAPPPPLDSLGLFSEKGQAEVTAPPEHRVTNSYKSRVPSINRVPSPSAAALADAQPWRVLTDADLVELDLPLLRRLFDEGVTCGWWADSYDQRRDFLKAAHHCATTVFGQDFRLKSKSENPRVTIFRGRLRQRNFRRLKQDSHDWATRVLRSTQRPSPLAADLAAGLAIAKT